MIYEQRLDPMGLKPGNSHDRVTRTHSLNFQLNPSADNQVSFWFLQMQVKSSLFPKKFCKFTTKFPGFSSELQPFFKPK
jgi:hypothetical protein